MPVHGACVCVYVRLCVGCSRLACAQIKTVNNKSTRKRDNTQAFLLLAKYFPVLVIECKEKLLVEKSIYVLPSSDWVTISFCRACVRAVSSLSALLSSPELLSSIVLFFPNVNAKRHLLDKSVSVFPFALQLCLLLRSTVSVSLFGHRLWAPSLSSSCPSPSSPAVWSTAWTRTKREGRRGGCARQVTAEREPKMSKLFDETKDPL